MDLSPLVAGLEASDLCRALVKHYESAGGPCLVASPDPKTGAAPWMLGWGHTRSVKEGDTAEPGQCEVFLTYDLQVAATVVHTTVRTPLKQNQFDALCALIHNIKGEDWVKDGGCTMLHMLNQGLYQGAAAQFARWNHAGGVVMEGLTRRREAERRLFMGTLADPSSPGFSWP